jgi:hypothetical protein
MFRCISKFEIEEEEDLGLQDEVVSPEERQMADEQI